MARIIFAEDEVEIEVADGARLQDAIAQAGASIEFGCREGECATCIVEILEGADNLTPINENEDVTLMDDEKERGVRLACQLRILQGTVKLKAAEDAF